MDEEKWARTVELALQTGAITAEPDMRAYRDDLVIAAIQALAQEMPNLDASGKGWTPLAVTVRSGAQ